MVVKMDCACMIIVVWEGEMPMKCASCVCMYVCVCVRAESNYTSSLLVTVVLEMLALIGVAGKCEVCFPPPLSPPPPPPPL